MQNHPDILFKQTDDTDLYLDLYMPDTPDTAANPPLIMWIHGGAWLYGDRKTPFLLRQTDRGYAIASIEYRLAGQGGVFPNNIIDCKDALIFLKNNACKYGYDNRRIVCAGDSAGGHLAALIGVSAGHAAWEPDGADCKVQAVIDYYGPIAVGTKWPSAADPDAPESKMLGAYVLSKKGRALAAAASPLTYIDGTEPPFLILHGNKDDIVPYAQSLYLRDKLESAGVPVSMHRVIDQGHGFDENAAVDAVIDDFLDYYIMRGK